MHSVAAFTHFKHAALVSTVMLCYGMAHPAGNNDIITLKADDTAEMLTLMYEDPKADRVSGERDTGAACQP